MRLTSDTVLRTYYPAFLNVSLICLFKHIHENQKDHPSAMGDAWSF